MGKMCRPSARRDGPANLVGGGPPGSAAWSANAREDDKRYAVFTVLRSPHWRATKGEPVAEYDVLRSSFCLSYPKNAIENIALDVSFMIHFYLIEIAHRFVGLSKADSISVIRLVSFRGDTCLGSEAARSRRGAASCGRRALARRRSPGSGVKIRHGRVRKSTRSNAPKNSVKLVVSRLRFV
jgi:hypothetical protein